jgi:hypothetical protein
MVAVKSRPQERDQLKLRLKIDEILTRPAPAHVATIEPTVSASAPALDTPSIVRPGECVVVDTTDRVLDDGELFVLTFAPVDGARCRVVQTLTLPLGGYGKQRGWWAAPYERRRYAFADGPYGEDVLSPRVIGRVVGIYAGEPPVALPGTSHGVCVTSPDASPSSMLATTAT